MRILTRNKTIVKLIKLRRFHQVHSHRCAVKSTFVFGLHCNRVHELMKMADMFLDLNGIMSAVEKRHNLAMQHAAEISPYVTERTLGADIHIQDWEAQKQQQPSTLNEALNESAGHEKTPEPDNAMRTKHKSPQSLKNHAVEDEISLEAYLLSISSESPKASNVEILDYQTVNTTVLLRLAEQERKRKLYQQVVNTHEERCGATTVRRSLEKQRQQLAEERDKLVAEQRRSDKQIQLEAEQLAAKELQAQKNEREALRMQTKRQLQLISFQGISHYQSKFRGKYEIVAQLLISIDKEALLACGDYNRKLKELIQMFDQLIGKLKAGECGECGAAELRTAEELYNSLDALEESIIVELENIVKREQQRADAAYKAEVEEQQQQQQKLEIQQQQQQQQKLEIQQQQQQQQLQREAETAKQAVLVEATTAPTISATPPVPTTSTITVTDSAATPTVSLTTSSTHAEQHTSNERHQFYTQIISFYQEKVEKVKPLQTDESMKKYRFACQKAINTPVNAISAVSPQHLEDKFMKLYNFFSGQPLVTADGQISINDHPLGRDYCILLMAKKFVSQGDTAISSNPQAAFPVASVIVSLWKLVPDFGQIFLAYVYKESPFLVPYLIPQQQGQTLEDYYKVLGYRISAGQVEPQEMFLKRQAGIARLYTAVMVTSGRKHDGPKHPYTIEHAWRWLTNFLTIPPLPDISATLMVELLQTAGADMWAVYGRQFVKLMLYMQQQYFPQLATVDEGGPKARLELLLSKFLQEGQILRPHGLVPPGFW